LTKLIIVLTYLLVLDYVSNNCKTEYFLNYILWSAD